MLGASLRSQRAGAFALASAFAAQIAFFFALTLVPFVGLTAAAATSWLPTPLGSALADALLEVFPAEAGLKEAAISTLPEVAHRSGWLTAAVLMAAWSSFAFMSTCVRALHQLSGGPDLTWRHRAQTAAGSFLLVLVWMAALLSAAFLVCLGPALLDTLGRVTSAADSARALAALRQVALGVVLVLAIRLTYGFVPGLGRSVGRLWAGAGFATAGWLFSAWAFTRLVPGLWQGRDLYGALASFMLFLLWSYANAWLLLLGGRVAGRG